MQNENLMKKHAKLQQKYKTLSAQLDEKEAEEEKLKKGVTNICAELPT